MGSAKKPDYLMQRLEKLLSDINRDAKRFEQKSKDALFLKPMAEWTQAEHDRYQRTNTDAMIAESDKWMYRQIDAEAAANDLRNIIFMRGKRLL